METDMERLERYRKEGFPEEAKTDEYWFIRLGYFEKHGYTKEAMTDEDWRIRLRYFRKHGFTEEAMTDKCCVIRKIRKGRLPFTVQKMGDIRKDEQMIKETKMETDDERLERYRKEGFPKEAMTDMFWVIRFIYFRKHGFTEEARTDEHWRIRLGYFEKHGYTKEAMTDEDWLIRQEAKIRLKKELDMELIKSISRTELEEMYRELLDYIQGLDSSAYEESSKCYLLNLQKWFINKINENN